MPLLPRLQLFEFNDLESAPAALRESLVESLSRALAWGRMLQGLVEPFAAFLEETGAREILDLCSGAGGPVATLADELRKSGRAVPRFLLTDLHPHPQVWAEKKYLYPQAIDFIAEPIDATNLPASLDGSRARLIINALHHLPPMIAGEVLREACKDGPGIFVAEGFERNPLRFFPFAPTGLAALFANLWLSPRNRLAKFFLLPFSIVCGTWDGVVSTLRVYRESELREMVRPLGESFRWTYGTYPFPLGGRGYWFKGVRNR